MLTSILTAIATRTGLGRGTIKLIGVGILIIALFVGWNLFLADVRRDALQDASAKAAVADRRADETASETRRGDDARVQAEIHQLERMKPDAPFAPVSAAEQRRFDCIRLQQQARRDHREPPACN